MSFLRKFVSMAKQYPAQLAIVAVVSAVFLGGAIVGVYNRLRARVPQLPAAR